MLWRGDGRLAARVTAVVKDASGKLYLLLPALLQENASIPFDLFIGVGPHQGVPIARVTTIIASAKNGPGVVLAELVGNGAATNGTVRALGTAPKLSDELHMAGATRIGTVEQVETTVTGIGPGFAR